MRIANVSLPAKGGWLTLRVHEVKQTTMQVNRMVNLVFMVVLRKNVF